MYFCISNIHLTAILLTIFLLCCLMALTGDIKGWISGREQNAVDSVYFSLGRPV